MRKRVAGLLLLAGCTVQVGRNPENQFTVSPDFPPPEGSATPDPSAPAVAQDGKASDPEFERNWRLGAEAGIAQSILDPAKRYAALYTAFRADHAEAARLREIRSRSAGRYRRRAAQTAESMEALLSDADRDALAGFLERYREFCEQADRLEGTLCRAESHRLESDFTARFAPDAVRLKEAATNPR